jgi:hypothetical protein
MGKEKLKVTKVKTITGNWKNRCTNYKVPTNFRRRLQEVGAQKNEKETNRKSLARSDFAQTSDDITSY